MKTALIVLATVATLGAAACGSSDGSSGQESKPAGGQAEPMRLPPAAQAGQSVLYGHVKSLTPKGDDFEMQFDPAWWLGGLTASRAALEDTGSGDVPNDYYIIEEGHRLLTYMVPATARVSVLTEAGPATRAIQVSELAQMVSDEKPRAGFWILVDYQYPSPVLSLDQQYQP